MELYNTRGFGPNPAGINFETTIACDFEVDWNLLLRLQHPEPANVISRISNGFQCF
jgi:hypothetical protein